MPIETPIVASLPSSGNGALSAVRMRTARVARSSWLDGAVPQDRELVATEPRHGIARLDGGGQAFAREPQQFVTRDVSQRVVDRLERVEIEIKQCQRLAGIDGRGESLAQFLIEGQAVLEAGEGIAGGKLVGQHPPRLEIPCDVVEPQHDEGNETDDQRTERKPHGCDRLERFGGKAPWRPGEHGWAARDGDRDFAGHRAHRARRHGRP